MSTVIAPQPDRCQFPACGLPRTEHGKSIAGHQFIGPSQIRLREPVDPFKNVRKMTEEERRGMNSRQNRRPMAAPPIDQPRHDDDRPKSPTVRTRALIVDSIERAIANIDICKDPILRDFRLKVDVDVERHITTAEATLSISLIFGSGG